MPEWSADFINDPNSDFDVVLEVRCAAKFADYIEGTEKNYKPYIGKW